MELRDRERQGARRGGRERWTAPSLEFVASRLDRKKEKVRPADIQRTGEARLRECSRTLLVLEIVVVEIATGLADDVVTRDDLREGTYAEDSVIAPRLHFASLAR